MSTDRLAALLDKQDCTELVLRVARAIDRCDADALGRLFHPDATDDHGSFTGTAADFVPWVMKTLAGMKQTQHVIGNVLVEVDGDRARGESYFTAYHTIAKPDGDALVVAAGRYLDRFERRGGEWRIAHRGAVYDWSSAGAASDVWNRAEPRNYRFGARGEADPSFAHFAGTDAA